MTLVLEPHRTLIWRLCYRMTGSAADAEDIVQETFARAITQPPADEGRSIRPWLVQVALNLSRDLLRQRKRRGYVGPWLPSPLELAEDEMAPAADARYDLAESASFAFLLALEALTPRQRAVLLLRDVFDYSVDETSRALDLSPGAVKTLHHRARAALAEYDRSRSSPSRQLLDRTQSALETLLGAVAAGDVARVRELLASDARLLSDGGGEFLAALRPVQGPEKVARMLIKLSAKNGAPSSVSWRVLNGQPALLVEYIRDAHSRTAARMVLRADLDAADRVREIHIVLASAKLCAVRSDQRAQRSASLE